MIIYVASQYPLLAVPNINPAMLSHHGTISTNRVYPHCALSAQYRTRSSHVLCDIASSWGHWIGCFVYASLLPRDRLRSELHTKMISLA